MKIGSQNEVREHNNVPIEGRIVLWTQSLQGTNESELKPEAEEKPHWHSQTLKVQPWASKQQIQASSVIQEQLVQPWLKYSGSRNNK